MYDFSDTDSFSRMGTRLVVHPPGVTAHHRAAPALHSELLLVLDYKSVNQEARAVRDGVPGAYGRRSVQHKNRRVVKREVKSETEQLVDLVCEEARQNII